MNKNGVIAVVVVVASIVLVGLWAMRSGEQRPGADCSGPPSPPTGLVASALPGKGRLEWAPPPSDETVTTYIIEAGSSPGANNQGTFVSPATSRSFERDAAGGTYYVRMFARNACGTSPASQEVTVMIK
jgi:hypothetical protein